MNFNAIYIEIKWISTALYLDSLEEIYSSIQILNRNKIEHKISYIDHYNRAAKKLFKCVLINVLFIVWEIFMLMS